MSSSSTGHDADVELHALDSVQLKNQTVSTFAWQAVNVTVNSKNANAKTILSAAEGAVKAGEILAIMGPSGSGKTTLLNALARRDATANATVQGDILIDGSKTSLNTFRRITSYVEQEDALIGSLTVRETLDFAARLSLSSINARERIRRVNELLSSFGLQGQSNTIIGTPIRKGISGGQKRRVSVASQLITGPKILFLDEPTSGLDSAASYEVISFVKVAAKEYNLIVIASIHQPSTSTFRLFDKLLLLSQGQTCYNGPTEAVKSYFDCIGFAMPVQINPAEYLLELTNIDFARDRSTAEAQLSEIQSAWIKSSEAAAVKAEIRHSQSENEKYAPALKDGHLTGSIISITTTLLHRSFIKSYRDVVVYGIRVIMYTGLAIMMGTVWLRLDTTQSSIQPFINAIFFGSAFMSFMAVAYVPAFLEDRATFTKERQNGLYGPTPFLLANFLIGLPYLFFISLLFSCIAYWLSNFRPDGVAFMTWVMWLFLDLVAAESLVVLVSSLFPNFVIALALTAFANGLWMSVGGFLVPPTILNVFWRYVFHYIDYQTYVFQGMMVNEFAGRSYMCSADCMCMYQSALAPQCKIAGTAVLEQYGYKEGKTGEWVGILLGIVVGYRLLGWLVNYLRKS